MYADVGDTEVSQTSSVDFVAEKQVLFQKAFALAREALGAAAERSKKRYDMRVKLTNYQVGNWVYYFCPRHRVGRFPKWQRFYSGPILVMEILGTVNLKIQKSARANMMVVHVDKVKQCLGETPTSWLETECYNVLPAAMELDALPNMFGVVDRSGVATFDDDGEINVVLRLKRNAGVPARFLSRIYAVYKDAPSDVCNHITVECVNNIGGLCLSRFSNMKRTARKVETFEYKCFPCLEQNYKARSYTTSYDLILHTVNTHRKFPVDARQTGRGSCKINYGLCGTAR